MTAHELLVCDAFPNGIPEEILGLQFDHINPHPGDNGIQYEPRSLSGMKAIFRKWKNPTE
ncbi:MAG: hypothetical protein HQM08_17370 [Candidatus Riflebacteria bacterium]|nr:hypothetical protein [Candidatus Riflebacteria bacterium]